MNAPTRRESQRIVDAYLALAPDVLMGGGRAFFAPRTRGGARTDETDVVEAFRRLGYAVASDPAELASANGPKLLGLFAEHDLAFEIDRDPSKEPTTAEMLVAVLRTLSRDNPAGFVLFVENENTDTAGHRNDAAALMRALWAFDEAVEVALAFRRDSPETLVVIASDHETGRLAITYAQRGLAPGATRLYPAAPQPRMIANITSSLGALVARVGEQPAPAALDRELAQHFPEFRLDEDLRAILGKSPLGRQFGYGAANILAQMVARQTGYYWGTAGHTGQPVPVAAIGPGAEQFCGYFDNTDFARRMRKLLP